MSWRSEAPAVDAAPHEPPALVELRLLGPVELVVGNAPVEVPAGKPRAILAVLGLAEGRPLKADELVTRVWGDDVPVSTIRALQVHISTLRKSLKAHGIDLRHESGAYRLDIPKHDIDVVRFERLAAEASGACDATRVALGSQLFRQALACWRGEPLADVIGTAAIASHEADRLAHRRHSVRLALADADLALGLGPTIVDDLTDLADHNPYDERACAQLMVALYRAGQPAAALARFGLLRRSLGDDLGLEPGPDVRAVESRILTHDASLLGVTSGLGGAAHNIPAETSTFVGRSREHDEIVRRLRAGRLVTLTGAGGVGKTRLAQRAAATMASTFARGACFVELAAIADPELVAATVLGRLRIADDPELPPTDALVAALRSWNVLILLDNCEHLIEAAADLTERLLGECADVRVLATSREPLGLDGEAVLRIAPLAVPATADLAELRGSDAVSMFVERTHLHDEQFELTSETGPIVHRVCQRLDGLPLAIELGAAQLRSMTLTELAVRLDRSYHVLSGGRRALARQQTMLSVVNWSYELLSDEERTVLDQLATFVGGFDLAAAEAVCDVCAIPVSRLLSSLVDKSLVEFSGVGEHGRYRLSEVVREFASERLASRPATLVDGLRRTHAHHYLTIAERANEVRRTGGDQVFWIDVLALEDGNLRAALAFWETSDVDNTLRMSAAMRRHWESMGQTRDALRLIDRFIDPAQPRDSPMWVRAAVEAAWILLHVGDQRITAMVEAARDGAARLLMPDVPLELDLLRANELTRRGQLEEALALLEDHADTVASWTDPPLIPAWHVATGGVLLELRRFEQALEHLHEAVRLAHVMKNDWRLGMALLNLAYALFAAGHRKDAIDGFLEAQLVAMRIGDRNLITTISQNLGLTYLAGGDAVRARPLLIGAYLAATDDDDVEVRAFAASGLATYLASTGEPERAACLHGAADTLMRDSGIVPAMVETEVRDRDQAQLRQRLGDEGFESAYSSGSQHDLDELVAELLGDVTTDHPPAS